MATPSTSPTVFFVECVAFMEYRIIEGTDPGIRPYLIVGNLGTAWADFLADDGTIRVFMPRQGFLSVIDGMIYGLPSSVEHSPHGLEEVKFHQQVREAVVNLGG